MTMPMLFGEVPLSESRKGFADGFVGPEWGRASRGPPREARGKRPMLRPWSRSARRRRGSFSFLKGAFVEAPDAPAVVAIHETQEGFFSKGVLWNSGFAEICLRVKGESVLDLKFDYAAPRGGHGYVELRAGGTPLK